MTFTTRPEAKIKLKKNEFEYKLFVGYSFQFSLLCLTLCYKRCVDRQFQFTDLKNFGTFSYSFTV